MVEEEAGTGPKLSDKATFAMMKEAAPYIGSIILACAYVDTVLSEFLYKIEPLAKQSGIKIKHLQPFSSRLDSARTAYKMIPELSSLSAQAKTVLDGVDEAFFIRNFVAHGRLDIRSMAVDRLVFVKVHAPKKGIAGPMDALEVLRSEIKQMQWHGSSQCTAFLNLTADAYAHIGDP